MTIALLFSLGTCIVELQIVGVNFACTKRLFNLSAEAIINVRSARLCAGCATFLLKIKQIPFSYSLVDGFTFLKRAQNQFKMLLEMCFVLASIVSTEKSEFLDGYVTTPRPIYACGKCGAWLFVHKIPFLLEEHVKTTKRDKTRFFFAKKDELGTEQLLLNVPFQSNKYRKKELCLDNEVQETIGEVYCPTCRNEMCVYV